MFSQDFKEFVELLIKNKAEYLIVGGFAVAIHGHPRYTGDLDIWINRTQQNAEIVVAVVNEFGFTSFQLRTEDFIKPGNVIQLGCPPNRIDLLTEIDGVLFKECFEHRLEVAIGEMTVNFIGYSDLLKNKRASGRPRDMDDIDNLK